MPNVSATTTPTLGALSKIRKQIAQKQTQANNTALLLTMENLQEAWSGYIDKLAQQKNHSAVTNFKLAQLRVADNSSFEIVVESNIQQKCIEQERGTLIEHLQSFYNNRSLSYAIYVEESTATSTPQERPLSSREQYLKMIEQYPMVKELKERLKLELDY